MFHIKSISLKFAFIFLHYLSEDLFENVSLDLEITLIHFKFLDINFQIAQFNIFFFFKNFMLFKD